MCDTSEPFYDVLVLIDGSDSYNNKVSINGKINAGEAFNATQQIIDSDLLPGLENKVGDRATLSIIQFSGIKQLAKNYTPGSGGIACTSGTLKHYQEEVAPTSVSKAYRNEPYAEGLDGNGQLFLCLQDINIDKNYINGSFENAASASGNRQRVLIIISDEEWDLNGLKDASGNLADREKIAAINRKNFNTYPVIVRPNEMRFLNDEFIASHLASKKGNYKKVFTKKFDEQLKKAFKEIIDDLE